MPFVTHSALLGIVWRGDMNKLINNMPFSNPKRQIGVEY
jgi:hypothetical protein